MRATQSNGATRIELIRPFAFTTTVRLFAGFYAQVHESQLEKGAIGPLQAPLCVFMLKILWNEHSCRAATLEDRDLAGCLFEMKPTSKHSSRRNASGSAAVDETSVSMPLLDSPPGEGASHHVGARDSSPQEQCV